MDAATQFDDARFLLVADRWCAFLVDGDNLIGRGEEVQICIESSWISRHHARIVVSDQGAIVEDLGSKNGTCVGSQRIEEPTVLTHGDVLRIGDVRIEFRNRERDSLLPTWTLEST